MSADSMDRRSFVAGAGVAAAGAAALGMAARTARAGESEAGSVADYDVDLVIVGSGMGGMCAGVQALQDGIGSVMIVEISTWVGGSTSWSYGAIHAGSAGKTDESFDEFTDYTATGDLPHAIFAGFEPLLHWVQDDLQLPMEVNYDIDTPFCRMLNEQGEGNPSAPRNFFDQFVALFEGLGGTILTQTAAKRILTDDDGVVTGLMCAAADGSPVRIAAKGVVLACGGFQNNQELKDRYLGREGHMTQCMGNPYNTGAGLLMATQVGASLQGAMSRWSGCVMAAAPAKNWHVDVASYEERGYDDEEGGKQWLYDCVIDNRPLRQIWVNDEGRRFVDENRHGVSAPQYISAQHNSSAILIVDSPAWDEYMTDVCWGMCGTIERQMEIITSEKVGGRIFQADTIEELADQLNAAGPDTYKVNKANLLATIEEYNEAARAGTGDELCPTKSGGEQSCAPIETAPFYAIPIVAAAYANYGGVAIDEGARVLDVARQPIAGLYATVPTAGGVFNEYYTGTVASAGITGRLAADSAAAYILG